MRYLPSIYDVFDDLFHDPFMNFSSIETMRTDIIDKDEFYEFNMELPGYLKEDIQIELKNGYLIVSASKNRAIEEKDESGSLVRRERYQGSCSRNFYVGDNLAFEDIKATFENGELRISLPKNNVPQVEEKRYIQID